MPKQEVNGNPTPSELRVFMKRLLDDVGALEIMLRDGLIESGVQRIGAEQETVLVEGAYRPAPVNIELLEALNDPAFTTELARFNVEFNLPPLPLDSGCLSQLEHELASRVDMMRTAADRFNAAVVLTGILPTLRLQDLELGSMTPMQRYSALNQALNRLRGNAYEFRIAGADELIIKHDSVMVESANTSFQLHLQVDPQDFANSYNVAQAIAAPVLAAAVNSPILFGRRLWKETRIAVFQQAVDTRTSSYYLQDHSSRVNFGRSWIKESVLELFQEDIARFRVLLGAISPGPDPFEELANGRIPTLKSLQLHNSTIYRWNRPCYGITDGKPHLRIENRVLPAGPSVLDETANAAFWFGLMLGMPAAYGDVSQKLAFENARANFVSAARRGLGTHITWLKGTMVPAPELILDELLPIARSGLESKKIKKEDIDRYLGVIEDRVRSRQTGSQWMLDSLEAMQGKGTMHQQLCALTATTIERQKEGKPVHEWPLANLSAGAASWKHSYMRVEQIMTTDVISVNQEELLELVARLMSWNNIRYVPVVDDRLHLVGLISHRALLRYLTDLDCPTKREVPVREVMHKLENELVTVSPETLTLDALELMREHRVGCLPVVKDGHMVGVVTERNFMVIAGQLLEEKLRSQ